MKGFFVAAAMVVMLLSVANAGHELARKNIKKEWAACRTHAPVEVCVKIIGLEDGK